MHARRLDPRLIDLPPWAVRVVGLTRGVAGAGVLVDERHVLTCAHVVNAAVGSSSDDQTRPADAVSLEFPNVPDGDKPFLIRQARVLAGDWYPIGPDETGDIAVMTLDEPVDPHVVIPAPLRRPVSLAQEAFSVRGYTAGRGGVLATGVMRDRGGPAAEWVQIEDLKVVGARIDRGFSGGGVFATDLQAVVGIVVAGPRTQAGERIANMIPLEVVARYWPPLEPLIRWRLDLDPDLATHWLPRAQGVEPEARSEGWYFTGRKRALAELCRWLGEHDPNPKIRLLSGPPGAGKSAILAHLLLLTDPILSRRVGGRDDLGVPTPLGQIDLAIHVKDRTLAEAIDSICAATDIRASTTEQVVVALRERRRHFRLVVDALDEAVRTDVARIANLLSRLALAGVPVLVGVRSGVDAGPIRDARVGLGPDVDEMRVDEPPWMDDEDLRIYIRKRLLLDVDPEVETTYRGQDELAEIVAAGVARRARPLFLVAHLTALRLVRHDPIDPSRRGWEQAFPTDIGGAVDLFISDLGDRAVPVRDLLTALAYAEADGFSPPLLALSASALSGRAYTVEDVLDLKESAASFLASSMPHAEAPHGAVSEVYRLFHQALEDHFRLPANEVTYNARLVTAFLSDVTTEAGQSVWEVASPYLKTHLCSYAAACNRLDELLVDPGYLAVASPQRLLPLLSLARSSEARDAAAVFAMATSEVQDAPVDERASYLELAGRQLGTTALADRIATRFPGRPWSAPSAKWRRSPRHVASHGHTSTVRAIALVEINSRPAVLSGDDDGVLRTWDAVSGAPLLDPLVGHAEPIVSLAATVIDGRPMCATGSRDGTVILWDLVRELPRCAPIRFSHRPVTVLCIVPLSQRMALLVGTDEGLVGVLDVETGAPLGDPIQGTWPRPVLGLTAGRVAGRSVAISAAAEGPAVVWDVERRAHLADLAANALNVPGEVVIVETRDRTLLVRDWHLGTTEVWDLGSVLTRIRARAEAPEPDINTWGLGEVVDRTVDQARVPELEFPMWDPALGLARKDEVAAEAPPEPEYSLQGGETVAACATEKGAAIAVYRFDGLVVYELSVGQPGGPPRVTKWPSTGVVPNAFGVGEVAGRLIVATGDGPTIRTWILSGSEVESTRLTIAQSDPAWMSATPLAMAPIDGSLALLATVDKDTLGLWPDVEGSAEGRMLRGQQNVDCGLLIDEGGRTIVLTAGRTTSPVDPERPYTLAVWDLAGSNEPILLAPLFAQVTTLITAWPVERDFVFAGSEYGEIWLWVHPKSGDEPFGKVFAREGLQPVMALAQGRVSDRFAMFAGGEGQLIRRFDYGKKGPSMVLERERTLDAHRRVTSLAVGEVDEQPVLVSGDKAGQVLVWDLSRDRVGYTAAAPRDIPVVCIALSRTSRRPILIAAWADGLLELHDPSERTVLHRIFLGAWPLELVVDAKGLGIITRAGFVRIGSPHLAPGLT